MKSFIFLISFWLGFFVPACAQTKGGIVKGYAYFRQSLPGTIMVDDNGVPLKPPLDTAYLIYIECVGKEAPVIRQVTQGKMVFPVSVYPLHGMEEPGIVKGKDHKIKLQPAKGNSLWRLEPEPQQRGAFQQKAKPAEKIIVTVKTKKGSFTFPIQKWIELEPIEHY